MRVGFKPTFLMRSFDPGTAAAATIQKAGTDRKAIRDELAKTKDFPAVAGNITFTEHGDVVKEYRKLVIRKGQFDIY